MTTQREVYKVLVVGASGKGKTMSARNLDRATTGFVNCENKPLPFPGRFEHTVRIVSQAGGPPAYQQVLQTIKDMALNPKIQRIVVDSFSAYMDMVLLHCRATKKGYDVWSEVASLIGLFLDYVKRCPKEVYVTAHYEILNIESASEKRVKTQGKAWEGLVESQFTIVLFADAKKEPNKRPEYFFSLMGQDTSAKCPPAIFGEDVFVIPNDLAEVDKAIVKFASAA